jgi:glutaminyl-tRNA synthetase
VIVPGGFFTVTRASLRSPGRRLSPGEEVRLRHGYGVRCTGVEKDEQGEVTLLHAEADLDTLDTPAELPALVTDAAHWAKARWPINAS